MSTSVEVGKFTVYSEKVSGPDYLEYSVHFLGIRGEV